MRAASPRRTRRLVSRDRALLGCFFYLQNQFFFFFFFFFFFGSTAGESSGQQQGCSYLVSQMYVCGREGERESKHMCVRAWTRVATKQGGVEGKRKRCSCSFLACTNSSINTSNQSVKSIDQSTHPSIINQSINQSTKQAVLSWVKGAFQTPASLVFLPGGPVYTLSSPSSL
jgi:hypothetical protein